MLMQQRESNAQQFSQGNLHEFPYPSTRGWVSVWTAQRFLAPIIVVCFLVMGGLGQGYTFALAGLILIPAVFAYRGYAVSEKVIVFDDIAKRIHVTSTNWYGHKVSQEVMGSYETFRGCEVKSEIRRHTSHGDGNHHTSTTKHDWIEFKFENGIEKGEEYQDVPCLRNMVSGLSMEEVAEQINSWWTSNHPQDQPQPEEEHIIPQQVVIGNNTSLVGNVDQGANRAVVSSEPQTQKYSTISIQPQATSPIQTQPMSYQSQPIKDSVLPVQSSVYGPSKLQHDSPPMYTENQKSLELSNARNMSGRATKYPSRWATMATALFFMTFGGCVYCFSLISDTVKTRLHLSQSDLDIIALFGRIGSGCTIVAGLFNNRYGPHISVWVGLAIAILGWGFLVLLAKQIIDVSELSYSYAIVSVGTYLFNLGVIWLAGIAGPTIAQNFPRKDHGKFLGLAKGYLGIGSAYIATFKADLVDGDVDKFMYSVLIYIPLFGLIFGWFLRQIPNQEYVHNYRDNEHSNRWKWWYFVACVLALYLITLSIVQNVITFNPWIGIGFFIIAQLLWYSPMALAIFNHGPFWVSFDDSSNGNEPLLMRQAINSPTKEIPVEMGMPDIFKTWDFWLLYTPFVIIAGSGLILIPNAAQIAESALSDRDHDRVNDSITTSLVTVISVGSFMGRIVAGILSDKYIDRYPRVFWNIVSAVGMCLSTLYMFLVGFFFEGDPQTTVILLLFGAFITGISYGWIFSVVLSSVSDLWGTKYLSGNYAIFDSCTPIGQIIFSNGVFATLYDYQGRVVEDDGTKCYGNKCFSYAFLIASASCLVAVGLTFKLWRMKVRQKMYVK